MAMSSGPPSLNGFCIFVSLYSVDSRDHGVGEWSHYPLETIVWVQDENWAITRSDSRSVPQRHRTAQPPRCRKFR